MDYIISNPKRRKSVGEVEDSTNSKKNRVDLLIENLGLENFKRDIVKSHNDLVKAGTSHLPEGAERFSYKPTSEYGVVYIPTNRLRMVYQTEKSIDPEKVRANMKKMKENIPLDPIQVGYNNDMHDGHHRWRAAIELGYSHVPCEVVGTDKEKVSEAKKKYRQLWKSSQSEGYKPLLEKLEKSLDLLKDRDLYLQVHGKYDENDIHLQQYNHGYEYNDAGDKQHAIEEKQEQEKHLPLVIGDNEDTGNFLKYLKEDEDRAVRDYGRLLEIIDDPEIREVISEILEDEKNHYHNLSVVLDILRTRDKGLMRELQKSIIYVVGVDLKKSGINKSRLIQKRVAVKGKDGKVFYRMQWVRPGDEPIGYEEKPRADEKTPTSYSEDSSGLHDLESRYSNKFPIRRIETSRLKNTIWNYSTDKALLQQAIDDYNNGKNLPPVHISANGEILDNHHLVDMAKELGLTHIPVVIFGNPSMKKKLEDSLKEDVLVEETDSETGETTVTSIKELNKKWKNQFKDSETDENLTEDIANSVEDWKKLTSQVYPKSYLMDVARSKDIVWKEFDKKGNPLAENSNILWMNASMAIEEYIREGNSFNVPHNRKLMNEYMKSKKKDDIQYHFMRLQQTFRWDNNKLMEYVQKRGISWKEHPDPSKNWMNAVMAIKKELKKGKMINGIRVISKQHQKAANLLITDQIKSQVKSVGQKYGKSKVMDRARSLGIVFPDTDSKGNKYKENSAILWMGASMAIQNYIAEGNEFTMGDGSDTPLSTVSSRVGDYGDITPTKMQQYAIDWSKRNSSELESHIKDYAKRCFIADFGVDENKAEELYSRYVESTKKSRVMIHFDPLEKLFNGSTLAEQLKSDGEFKNDYALQRSAYDQEHKEANEADIFGVDYNEADNDERPTYAVLDLYGNGRKSSNTGNIAFVLKNTPEINKRTTCIGINSDNIPYGQSGMWVRSIEDSHQLLFDRYMAKWKQPKKANAQRKQAITSIIKNTPYKSDIEPYEAHIHGRVDLAKDIDYITVPKNWEHSKNNKSYEEIKSMAKLFNLSIKYE